MQHNIRLDERSELILAEQLRGFNLSKFVREALIELESSPFTAVAIQ